MKKMIILVCLLISVASASLEIQQKNVFAGEEFTVLLSAKAPTSEHTVKVILQDQEKEASIPEKEKGVFYTNISFTAPEAGQYEIKSKYGNVVLEVKEPLLIIEDFELEPMEIEQSKSADLHFKIRNPGEYMVYNVNYELKLYNPGFFEFENKKQDLGNLARNQELERTEIIRAKEDAEGKTSIQLIVEYEFDGEKHYQTREKELRVKGMPWIDWIILMLLFAGIIILLVEIASRKTKH